METLMLMLMLMLLCACSLCQESKIPSGEVCYENLGCFSNGGHFYDPFRRPVSRLPNSPEKVNVQFFLFTRRNVKKSQMLVYNSRQTVDNSNFNPNRPTKLIIHGFTDSIESGWMLEMKDALLQRFDYNVIVVDWSGGNYFPYSQAVANTRLTGAVIARLLLWLERLTGSQCSQFHIIGHSLGAHTAGYAGERLQGRLGRITALDPAGPYFAITHPTVRLDPTDAGFVDVIHTDGESVLRGGFGLFQPLGHLDFYPNGGKNQPGCTRNPIISITEEGTMFSITCNHVRVMPLLISILLNQRSVYRAVLCRSYADFKQGKCTCANSECVPMGLDADKWRPNGRENLQMYLDTSTTEPFAVNGYYIKVTISEEGNTETGDVSVELQGSGNVGTGLLTVATKKYMKPGSEVTAIVNSKSKIDMVRRVRVQWRDRGWLSNRKLFLKKVQVVEWDSQRWTQFCSPEESLESNKSLWLETC